MDYWILVGHTSDSALIDGLPKSKIRDYRYAEGESLAKEFPKKATMSFSVLHPDRHTALDFLDNLESILIVSQRVRDVLDKLQAVDLEYLPVTILDHKKKPLPMSYFILNPLGGQDAADMKKSEVRMDPLAKGQVHRFKKLVVNPKGIKKGAKLFRLSISRYTFMIDGEVRDAFKAAGIKGYWLYQAKNWNGLTLGGERY